MASGPHTQSGERVRALATGFLRIFPKLDAEQEDIVLATYRELASGEPATLAGIAARSGASLATVRESLESWPGVFWEDGSVIGFWGLTARPFSKHRMHISGRTLYGWCAWDTLFLPELLGEPAVVDSEDPVSHSPVRLTVGPAGAASQNSGEVTLSLLQPMEEMMADVVANLCHFIHFFETRANAEAWAERNPGTILLSLDEGFELGRAKNAGQFPSALEGAGDDPG